MHTFNGYIDYLDSNQVYFKYIIRVELTNH